MPEAADFHTRFTTALAGDAGAIAPWLEGPDAELRFSVYRNTVAKGLVDALAAQFPTVARIAGEAWMREAGLRFARRHPPRSASLLAYGGDFPAWLEGYGPAGDLPFLAALARADDGWRRSYFAPDREPLDAATLAQLDPSAYSRTIADLHPGCVALSYEDRIATLWMALQADALPPDLELLPGAETLVFLRPRFEVTPLALSPGGGAFLEACAGRRSLAEAADAALACEPGCDLSALFATLIAGGAFARLAPAA